MLVLEAPSFANKEHFAHKSIARNHEKKNPSVLMILVLRLLGPDPTHELRQTHMEPSRRGW